MRALLLLLVLVCAPLHSAAQPQRDPIPIESFFKLPQYASMTLSPDGKHIAALAPLGERQGLIVIDLEKRKATPIASAPHLDAVQAYWVNSNRIVYRFATLGERVDDVRGGIYLAIDRDGSNRRELRVEGRPVVVVRTFPNESDDVIVRMPGRGGTTPVAGDIRRMNIRTGVSESLSLGKPEVGQGESWIVDDKGTTRVFTAYNPRLTQVFYRAGPQAAWTKIAQFARHTREDAFTALAIAEDGKSIYVSSRHGGDKSAIYRYDPEKKAFGEAAARHPQVDVDTTITDHGVVRGVWFDADRPGTVWFEEDLARVQSAIDKALPDRVNSLSWSDDRSRFLVQSYSDVSPGSFFLFDRNSGKLEWLADRRPWIKPEEMSPMRAVRLPARDGKEIPAYLTMPRGSSGKNLPIVVVVHGGPWVHGDSWRWNPEVQFLASRGYAVLQPNFRGTLRYGWDYYASSFRQWGLTMQDDVEDALKWAIAEGIADPSRACIYGGSYGGYAAMMGVAKTPDLFKCAINYVGVTDLTLLLTASWSDTWHSQFAVYSWSQLIGTTEKDSERLEATSPTKLAARIKAPVMMAYGASDIRVVPEHGTMMKAALERAGNPPEVWMMVDGEGHGFRRADNQVMFYGAMEKFLDKHIGARQ